MKRTLDATFLNRVANDESVRPTIGGSGDVDLSSVIADPGNFAFVSDHGGFILAYDEPGRYGLHTLFLPEGRGANVLASAKDAFRYMFTRTDCVEIVTKVAGSNRPADLMARRAGFSPIFIRQGIWPDGSDVTFFAMTLDAWRASDPGLAEVGHDFHEMLAAAKRATGSELPTHPDDDAHDRAAGAAALMASAGQARKAVWTYNRWARLAGYQTIEVLSEAPPIIDVRDALVTVANGELEVLSCR